MENGGIRMIDARGVRLAMQAFGRPEDPALVLVMGATASMLGWPEAFCTALAAAGFHVIRFDHRDTGASDTAAPGAPGYHVEDMAADVVAILDACGIASAHVAGMSLGGYIAQMVALDHPSRVLSVTLIASEPLGWDGAPLPGISPAVLEHFAGLATLDWGDRAVVSRFLAEIERLCAGRARVADDARIVAHVDRILARTATPASMFNHAGLATRRDWTGRFRDIGCPVLVVHGDEDPILPVENGHAVAEGIPGAELILLQGTGHEIPDPVIPRIVGRMAALRERR